jgi:hypothetical protein
MPPGTTADRFKWFLLIVVGILIALAVIGGVAFKQWSDAARVASAELRATAEVERLLTEAYGAEARTAIENFESRWLTLDSIRDASLQSEVATGPFLEYFGHARRGDAIYAEPFWLVTSSVVVERIRVLEYSPQRFKAIACVTEITGKTTTEGALIETLPPREFQGVYVFARDSNAWKLAGFFDVTDPRNALRDWDYAPDWLRQTIGNLPGDLNDCETQPPGER